MASAELIGKLCAGVMRMGAVRGSGISSLSKGEMAGMLAGLSPAEMNMAMAKYALDDAARSRLMINVLAFVCDNALSHNWRPRQRGVLLGMATLAISEVVDGNYCGMCGGSGLSKRGLVCKYCDGGHKKLSGRAKAKRIGIDEKAFRNDWSVRYEIVFYYVNGLDRAVRITLALADRKFIKDDEILCVD